MAKLIGGIAHGKIMDGVTMEYLHIPVLNNWRVPKEQRRSGVMFMQCTYRRTRLIRDGERVYRFISGYYEPIKDREL